MFYGNNECFRCPKCYTILYNPILISGNTGGTKVYSDVRRISPMMPSNPKISKCISCQTIFWLDQDHAVKCGGSDDKKMAEFLSIEDNVNALMNKNYKTKQQERNLRLDLWRKFNDRVLLEKSLLKSELEEEIWAKNLHELLEVLDDDEDKILKAEIYRNLENFEKSKELMQCLNTEEYQPIYQQYMSQLEIGNSKVFEIKLEQND